MHERERHRIILSAVQERPILTVQDIVELTDASEATIRRDFGELAQRQLVTRKHGGIVATSVAFFGIGNYLKLIPYYFLGQLNTANLSTALLFSPLAPLGVWLGIWLHKRISEAAFFQVSYLLLFASGLKLIYDAVV